MPDYQSAAKVQGVYYGDRTLSSQSQITGLETPPTGAPVPPNKIMDIHITPCSYGFLVTVGCSNFAIEKASDLIARLSEYINKPAETVQKWNDGKLFS